MTTQRTNNRANRSGGIGILLNVAEGSHSSIDVPNSKSNKIFDVGGGYGIQGDGTRVGDSSSYQGEGAGWQANAGFGVNFGEWVFIPSRTFAGQVQLWGGGGGSHSHGGSAYGGGGGYARGEVMFMEGIPYTIWVGQGGSNSIYRYDANAGRHNYRIGGTFGGGGAGGHNAGSGGGASGLFFNTLGHESQGAGHSSQGHGADTAVGGVSTWFRTPSQNNALLMAGGGGGAGHINTGHHSQGGGGGGTNGQDSHNTSGATQTSGGNHWTNGAQSGAAFAGGWGGNSTHCGGGGGGWFGGGGGSHHNSHYNGGSGGSGHSLDINSISGFRNFWIKSKYSDMVRNSYLEASPSSHSNQGVNMAAGRGEADWGYAGLGAGTADHNSNSNSNKWIGFYNGHRVGTNGRVVIRVLD